MKRNIISINNKVIILSSCSILLAFSLILVSRSNVFLQCPVIDVPADVKSQELPKVTTSDKGATLINGKPFFPLGFYHVSWQTSEDKRTEHLYKISAAGFNTIHTSFNATPVPSEDSERINKYREFLDEAEKLGVYVLTEFSIDERLKLVNELKDKPAVLGWNIADDADNGQKTPKKLFDYHCELKNTDPNHLTYISGFKAEEISRYVNTADAIGVQAYPVGDKRDRPFSWPYYMISIAHDSAPEKRLIIANSQAFRWHGLNAAENAPIPTFEEVRNMTYQSLIAGAKGIIYYTYFDSAWNFDEYPELWQEIQSIVPEIKKLSPILLEGDLQEISTMSSNLLAGVWTYKKQTLAIVVNTSPDKAADVTLKLPGNEAISMFSTYDSSTNFKNGKLSGTLAPLEVHVYELFN